MYLAISGTCSISRRFELWRSRLDLRMKWSESSHFESFRVTEIRRDLCDQIEKVTVIVASNRRHRGFLSRSPWRPAPQIARPLSQNATSVAFYVLFWCSHLSTNPFGISWSFVSVLSHPTNLTLQEDGKTSVSSANLKGPSNISSGKPVYSSCLLLPVAGAT